MTRFAMFHMTIFMVLSALTYGVVGVTAPAWAQSDLDRCNDILQQDLFNRVNKSTQSSSSEKTAYAEYIFSLDDTAAFAEYQKAYKSSKKEEQTGNVEGGYAWGFIDGDVDFSHSYERQLDEKEFSKEFEKAKKVRQKNLSTTSSREASLISVYQSSVRDTESVKAWEKCMSTKYQEPGLFAYGYRDPSGNPFIVVVWAPGTLAAANPGIAVRFSVTEPGMTVEGAPDAVQIGTGSGAAFPIRFSIPNDRKAQADGFAVLVNGELTSGNRVVQSFRSEAIVPRNLGPIPCSAVFTANRSYQLGIRNSRNEMAWYADIVVLEQRTQGREGRGRGAVGPAQEPTDAHERDYPATLNFQGQFTMQALLRLTGTDVVIVAENETESMTFWLGQCTGKGVSRLVNTQNPQIELEETSIRAR